MSIINKLLRPMVNKHNQKQLKNHTFSMVASNCNGAFICHDLAEQFRSPFVNLWMYPSEFIKYLEHMEEYMQEPLTFIESETDYPVGLLKDVHIYFQHYSSEEEARQKWEERTKRINLDNLYILMTDRDGCTYEDLKAFDALPYEHKIVFTHKEYPELKSTFCIHGYEQENQVGNCFEFYHPFTSRKYYDEFPYVTWLNKNI